MARLARDLIDILDIWLYAVSLATLHALWFLEKEVLRGILIGVSILQIIRLSVAVWMGDDDDDDDDDDDATPARRRRRRRYSNK